MTPHTGFAFVPVLIAIAILVAVGGGAYVATHQAAVTADANVEATTTGQTAPGDHPEVDHPADEGMSANGKIGVSWKLENQGTDANNIPHTKVTAIISGQAHEMGSFQGSCKEIGAEGGVDGKGLLAGELAAVQCWFAGGGDEIGVFANEDGGIDLMVGSISEPDGEGATGFRGDFSIKAILGR